MNSQTKQTTKQPTTQEAEMLRKLFKNEQGQDMIEYAILASFISIVAIVMIKLIGPMINTIYTNVSTALHP